MKYCSIEELRSLKNSGLFTPDSENFAKRISVFQKVTALFHGLRIHAVFGK